MRYIAVITLLVCLCFPVFSQNANQQRFSTLSDYMGSTISRSNDNLADFDSQIQTTADFKIYASYRLRYEYYVKALQESELLLNRMLRSNDRVSYIKDERNRYESLIKELEATKSDYDNFVRSVR